MLSVVIPTRDRVGLLPDTLARVLADPAIGELVVVDDGSADATPEVLRSLARADPRVVVVRLTGVGPARARQEGALRASGDVLLFLEDDIHVSPGLASRHSAGHGDRDDLVLVGYTPVGLPRGRGRGDGPVRLYAREYERVCRRWEAQPDTVLLSLYGGHFSIRRDRALEVGLVSSRFPERCHEDQDFGLRCRRAALHGRFDRDLAAEHRYRRDVPGFLADARCRGAGKFRVHALHGDLVGPFAPAAWWDDLPAPVARLVRATARPRLRAAALAVLRRGGAAAVAGGLPGGELAALKVARRILMLDGARAVSRGLGEADLRVRSSR